MIVRDITTVEELDAFRSDWDALFARSGSEDCFVSHAWIRACVVRFLRPGEWSIAVAVEGDRALALLPLRKNGRDWTFLLVEDLADYCEILCDPARPDAVEALVAHVLRAPAWRRVRLSCMPADGAATRLLPDILRRHGAHCSGAVLCVAPTVAIEGTFENFERQLSKRLRQEIRTTRNHLNRLGEWRFEDVQGGTRAREIYDRLVAMHLDRQEGKVGASLFAQPATRDFLRDWIPQDQTHADVYAPAPVLTGLFVGDRIVAAAYSLLCGGTFYYWIPSFDSSIKGASLGKALIAHLLETQFARGGRVFDFMGGDEPYKFQWSSTQYEVHEVTVFRYRHQLMLFRARSWLVARLRELVRSMPRLRGVRVILSKIG